GAGRTLAVSATSLAAKNRGAALVSLANTQAASPTVASLSTLGGSLTFTQSGGGAVQFTGLVSSGSGAVNGGAISLSASNGLTVAAGAAVDSRSGSGGALTVRGAVTLNSTILL